MILYFIYFALYRYFVLQINNYLLYCNHDILQYKLQL